MKLNPEQHKKLAADLRERAGSGKAASLKVRTRLPLELAKLSFLHQSGV